MVIFIRKIKTKEGINSINLDKIKKEVPSEFEIVNAEPEISYTANHIVVAVKCKLKAVIKKEPVKKEPVNKKVAVKKKVAAAKS